MSKKPSISVKVGSTTDRLFVLPPVYDLLDGYRNVRGFLHHVRESQQAGWGLQPFKHWWVQIRFQRTLSTRGRRALFDWVGRRAGMEFKANYYGTDHQGILIQDWEDHYPPALSIAAIATDLQACGPGQIRAAPECVHLFDKAFVARQDVLRKRTGGKCSHSAEEEEAARRKVDADPDLLTKGNGWQLPSMQAYEAFHHETITIAPWYTLDYRAMLADSVGKTVSYSQLITGDII